MALGRAASATDHAQEAKCAYPENKAVRRLACSYLDFEHCWPEQVSESRILE